MAYTRINQRHFELLDSISPILSLATTCTGKWSKTYNKNSRTMYCVSTYEVTHAILRTMRFEKFFRLMN